MYGSDTALSFIGIQILSFSFNELYMVTPDPSQKPLRLAVRCPYV